ncbi:MAG TPA: hypothetical protein VGX03_03495 [Candidatus Binatia bacterium]|nr:hypothetical protein [Candidatus Binatia bacterium]
MPLRAVFLEKDGPLRAAFNRFTFIFAKGDGQWREVAIHVSQIPSGSLSLSVRGAVTNLWG